MTSANEQSSKPKTIIAWSPISETEWIPPFGEALRLHLEAYRSSVRYASCSAWRLLYRLLEENGLPLGTVAFEKNGKPYFSDVPIYFSLSHSKGVCAVAVCNRPVGVDIEQCSAKYHPRLMERSFAANERTAFDGDFTRLWCRKEAVSKMTGEGIVDFPRYIDTTAYEYEEQMLEWNNRKYWLIALISCKKDYT